MKYRFWWVPLLALAASEAGADSSYVGVLVYPRHLARSLSCDEPVAFGKVTEIELEVSVTNSRGDRELSVASPVDRMARWVLTRDGAPLAAEEFTLAVAGEPEKFVADRVPGTIPDYRRVDLLEPGTGVRIPMILRVRSPLADGLYVITAELPADQVAVMGFPAHEVMGLVGGGRFRVIRKVAERDVPNQMVGESNRLLQKGRPEDAVRILQSLTRMFPEEQGYWDRLGMAQVAAGDYPAAVRSFERIDASGKRVAHSPVPIYMASAYAATGEGEKARAVLLKTGLPPAEAEAELRKMEERSKKPTPKP